MTRRYKNIPRLLTATQAGLKLGLKHRMVKIHARNGRIGFYLLPTGDGLIETTDAYYFTAEDVRRFKMGLPPIPQSKR